jgi:hypothetical protein
MNSSKFPSSDFSGSNIGNLEISGSDLSYSLFTDVYEREYKWNEERKGTDELVKITKIKIGKCIVVGSFLQGIHLESTLLPTFLENETSRRFRKDFIIMESDSKVYPYRVFICHAREDGAAAKSVFDYLSTESDMVPWLDKFSLLPGQDWKREVRKAIKDADAIIILCSPHSMRKRGFVQQEFKLALDELKYLPPGEIFIIPMRIASTEIIDDLKELQVIDYEGEESLAAIAQAIRAKPRSRLIVNESEESGGRNA